jgi:hypothetical protein
VLNVPEVATQIVPSVERCHSIVEPAEVPDTLTVTLLDEHIGDVPVTVPATGAALIVIVTAVAEVTVEHGELVARTYTSRVTALDDVFVNVKSNDVVPPITVNECHVAWLSSEYS